MKAHDAAKQASAAQEKVANAMHHPDPNAGAPVDNTERLAVPVAKEEAAVEEIPIAGRTKMQITKNPDSEAKPPQPDEKEEEGLKATGELNRILKQAPSMLARILSVYSTSQG